MENRSGVLGADRQNRQKRGALLLRLWRYLGRNRLLLAAAVGLSLGSNILALFGPRLGGPGHQRHCGGTRPGGSPLCLEPGGNHGGVLLVVGLHVLHPVPGDDPSVTPSGPADAAGRI